MESRLKDWRDLYTSSFVSNKWSTRLASSRAGCASGGRDRFEGGRGWALDRRGRLSGRGGGGSVGGGDGAGEVEMGVESGTEEEDRVDLFLAVADGRRSGEDLRLRAPPVAANPHSVLHHDALPPGKSS